MPTENRSSNTEMVSVPPYIGLEPLVGRYYPAQCRRCGWVGSSEELTEDDAQCTQDAGDRLCLGDCDELDRDDLLGIIQAMAKAAQQHHGEPVAYQIRSKTDRPGSQWTPWRECCETTRAMHSHEVGRFNQHGILREIRPVFIHADSGEIERLRADLAEMTTFRDNAANHMRRIRAEATAFEKDRDSLRSQLAERDELLSEALRSVHADADKCESSLAVEELEGLSGRIKSALSASAEPSAPLPPVEGDLLPSIGSKVLIHLAREDEWVEHTVVGYYAWGNHGLDQNVHRVFVRVRDVEGFLNARMLNEIRPIDEAATSK